MWLSVRHVRASRTRLSVVKPPESAMRIHISGGKTPATVPVVGGGNGSVGGCSLWQEVKSYQGRGKETDYLPYREDRSER